MKIKFTLSIAILSLVALIGIESCKNDVDIFASGKDVTVIYGLLSAEDAIHKIKVNRIFQGVDAVAVLAQDPSLSEYENIEVSLLEIVDHGFNGMDTLNKWTFSETNVTNKDSGFFYYPNQKVYELEQQLNGSYLYSVQVDKLDGSAIVSATTELVNVTADNMLKKPVGLLHPGPGLSLATTFGQDGEFVLSPSEKITLEVNVPINAKVVDVYLDFSYQERDLNFDLGTVRTLKYYVGQGVVNKVPTEETDVRQIKIDLNPTAFYEFIAANVSVVEEGDDIFQRQPLDVPLTFRFISGGDEFNTFLEVAAPSTSLLETKPEYTNINNGIGLWSSRSFNEEYSKMSENSINYLVGGEITLGRRFCHYTNNDAKSPCYQ